MFTKLLIALLLAGLVYFRVAPLSSDQWHQAPPKGTVPDRRSHIVTLDLEEWR